AASSAAPSSFLSRGSSSRTSGSPARAPISIATTASTPPRSSPPPARCWPCDSAAFRLPRSRDEVEERSVVTLARSPLAAHLLELVARRVPARRAWLREVAAAPDVRTLETAFAEASRRLGAAPLALVCDSPYPGTHFHEVHFDDRVLAALEADLPLARMVGLGARVTERLATAAARVAATRRASGRRPPADLWRLVWGVA